MLWRKWMAGMLMAAVVFSGAAPTWGGMEKSQEMKMQKQQHHENMREMMKMMKEVMNILKEMNHTPSSAQKEELSKMIRKTEQMISGMDK